MYYYYYFLNRHNLSRNKCSEGTKEETGKVLAMLAPSTQTPSYMCSVPSHVSYLDSLCIYKAGMCIHLPLAFFVQTGASYMGVLCAFSPPFSLRDGRRESVLALWNTLCFFLSWGYIVFLHSFLGATLCFFILFLWLHCVALCSSDRWCDWFSANSCLAFSFSVPQAVLLWTSSYICVISHTYEDICRSWDNLFLSTQLWVKWKQGN